MAHTFGVDLRGIIDLLSHHLYSSPRVYARELLQNAVDAITARRALQPDAPGEVVVEPVDPRGNGTLRISDTGIGLTEREVHDLLSTLGRTSKRDELGFARQGFLGQFGVGLLSAFLVAERVHLVSRSARGGPAVRWTADAAGNYEVEVDESARAEVGTTIELVPSRDAEHWLEHDVVRALVGEYGELLPVTVRVGDEVVTAGELPWLTDPLGYGERVLGVAPFDAIPVEVPAVGLTGVAYVLPRGVHPGARQSHRVYLKRMLVGDAIEGLLPDWAYFVRCVVDTSSLRPTASREALYQDETLLVVREELGRQVRDWLVRLDATDPDRTAALLDAHHLGIKSLARVDEEMLRLVERWLPFETTDGAQSLRQFRRKHGTVLYLSDVDEFRQLAPVAHAQGMGLLNAGYAYDLEILERLVAVDGPGAARRVAPTEVLAALGEPERAVERAVRERLALAAEVLARHDCEAVPREFDPASLPALLVADADGERRRDAEQAGEAADPLWAELLGSLVEATPSGASQRLVLNCRNPLVRRLAELADPALVELTVESLYVHALLQSRRPMRPKDTAALNRSFLDLLDRAVRSR
ncbi:HSP90 family protein [Saccharothrix coeruleofusca]|uniref:Molecular chaperone HtpG n=1 Tax=Saccharothrix coeruleofusca TaxID=33919 RepID=A0A918AK90_9PSEU|nr:HSP90 family protein [Saccharothrix coeruleofusca]MBP2338070.1 molecular chaperone HtpG [Saccharothrix coeruleofusca]GGP50933.1 molecular chaperone HtpG [Saccharothrix coeruleofusca]